MKLYPISRVYHLITYAHNCRFLTLFIELIIDRELHAMSTLELKFGLSKASAGIVYFWNVPRYKDIFYHWLM